MFSAIPAPALLGQGAQCIPVLGHAFFGELHLPLELGVVGRDAVAVGCLGQEYECALCDLEPIDRFARQYRAQGIADPADFHLDHGRVSLCYNE